MVADVGDVAQTTPPVPGASPSSITAATGPCPVKKSEMELPGMAGLWEELAEPSEFTAAARPFTVNKAGAAAFTVIAFAADSFPLTRATTLAGPAATSLGTCALICPEDTKTTGAVIPLIVTETSPIDKGSGVPDAEAAAGAKPEPNIEISDPGAIESGEKAAPSATAAT